MIIDGHPKEKDALAEFHKGNREEFLRLQGEFVEEFREYCKAEDHCTCANANCLHHGNCMECVAIHRAHEDHVPACLRSLVNKKLKVLSELTEHTIVSELKK